MADAQPTSIIDLLRRQAEAVKEESDDKSFAQTFADVITPAVEHANEVQGEGYTTDVLQEILDRAEQTGELNQEDIDAFLADVLPDIEKAQARANYSDQEATQILRDAVNDPANEIERQVYGGDIESAAALAEADPEAIGAQQWTLDELRGLSTPEMTAAEEFMLEQAKQQQANEIRARREAALHDMAARGVRSGGAEMTALLGAESQTAGNRRMADLGAQANAVQRAMDALGMHGDLASTMREESFSEDFSRGGAQDAISKFNSDLSNSWNQWREERDAEERDKRLEREKTLSDRLVEQGQNEFGRSMDVGGFKGEAAGLETGTRLKGNEITSDALSRIYAEREKEKALARLDEKPGGLFGTGFGPDFGPDFFPG